MSPVMESHSRIRSLLVCSVLLTCWFGWGDQLAAQTEESARIEFFERRVRPLLAKHCFACHGDAIEQPQGNLKVDGRAELLKGGNRGPAVVPHRPDESLLIQAVRGEPIQMPPGGRLKEREVADLVEWVRLGAPWPEAQAAASPPVAEGDEPDWEKIRAGHWAWAPVRKPAPPKMPAESWIRNPIDSFVLAKLESAGLEPAPAADSRTLVRRMHLDLVGLPPTPEEVAEFVSAFGRDRRGAVEQKITELLGSVRYGERWARHWLDVARYSDGFGGFLDRRNRELTQAWRYRDWVVSAFNHDLPYDRFVKLQISGDLVGETEDAVATGFFALGPYYTSDGGDPDSVAQARGETLDDRIDTLTRGFMAVTVSCARCHDHKFDPIPQQDYYSLAGIFDNTVTSELPLVPEGVVDAYEAHQEKIKALQKKQGNLGALAREEMRELSPEEKELIKQLKAEVEKLKEEAPAKYDFLQVLAEAGNQDMPLAVRGNLRTPGDMAPRRFLKVLSGTGTPRFNQGSGRVELAEAVASSSNPLTARVMVNRVWMHHFGKALVRSPGNFGTLGRNPTHGKMLDWLAAGFMESNWSIKSLHRLIMTSATYQMSSRFDARAFAADSDNELLWRMNPRRMDVESWRDSLLAVTRELDLEMGGPPVDDITGSNRRTLYAKVSRNGDQSGSDQFLRLFDFPIMRATVSERGTSIVPQQFLFLMNSPFMVDRAKALSKRLESDFADDSERIGHAYRLLFGRSPSEEETRMGLRFLQAESPSGSELSSWERYGQVLMSSNEFMYVR